MFKHEQTRLEWVVSDRQEFGRVRAGIVCRGGGSGAHVIGGRTIFYRPVAQTAWMCIPIPAGTRWYPSVGTPIITPLGKLTISVRQIAGRTGRLRPNELERMLASARRSSVPGRTTPSSYELPSRDEVRRMTVALRRPLFLPTRLPGGFIFSDWAAARRADGVPGRRRLSLHFGRDSLFAQMTWVVTSGGNRLRRDCSRYGKPPQTVINGRAIYVNEAIHSVELLTCIAPGGATGGRAFEISMWYDIRLNSAPMLRRALRMIGTAKLIPVR